MIQDDFFLQFLLEAKTIGILKKDEQDQAYRLFSAQ